MTFRHAIVLCFAAFSAASALAQTQTQTTPAPEATQPDVLILANVRARELRFDAVPQVSVTFPGQENNATVWHSDRFNLPDQVQPYVIYRDIGIRLVISSSLPNIEQIVDEALAPEPAQAESTKPTTKTATKKSSRHRR
jgi:hypothetical protein